MVNGRHIRGSLPQGPVTLGDLLAALPFDSPVVSLELTGKQLVEVLEKQRETVRASIGQVSASIGLAGKV